MSTLADVYPFDMGRYAADLPLWAEVLADVGTVIEIGCGNGRIPKALAKDRQFSVWKGIDVDPAMVALFNEDRPIWARALKGDAISMLDHEQYSYDAAIIPYSTFFLFPHNEQSVLLHACKSVADRVYVDVFVPQMMQTSNRSQIKGLVDDRIRKSTFSVDTKRQITEVTRVYEQAGVETHRLNETICWRYPGELLSMARAELGHESAHFVTSETVPQGNVLLCV